jgi:hypothetical protein
MGTVFRSESMPENDLDYCRQRIADETLSAQAAPYPEVAEKHLQLAALYQVQLAGLTRQPQARPGQGSSYAG